MTIATQPETRIHTAEAQIFDLQSKFVAAQQAAQASEQYWQSVQQIASGANLQTIPDNHVQQFNHLVQVKMQEGFSSDQARSLVTQQAYINTLSRGINALQTEKTLRLQGIPLIEQSHPDILPLVLIPQNGQGLSTESLTIIKAYGKRKGITSQEVITKLLAQQIKGVKDQQLREVYNTMLTTQTGTKIDQALEVKQHAYTAAQEKYHTLLTQFSTPPPTPNRRPTTPAKEQAKQKEIPETPEQKLARDIVTQGFGQISFGKYVSTSGKSIAYKHGSAFYKTEYFAGDTSRGDAFGGQIFEFNSQFGTIIPLQEEQLDQFYREFFGNTTPTLAGKLHTRPENQVMVIKKYSPPIALSYEGSTLQGKDLTQYTYIMPAQLERQRDKRLNESAGEYPSFVEFTFVLPPELGQLLEGFISAKPTVLDDVVNILFPGLQKLEQEETVNIAVDRLGRYAAKRLDIIDHRNSMQKAVTGHTYARPLPYTSLPTLNTIVSTTLDGGELLDESSLFLE